MSLETTQESVAEDMAEAKNVTEARRGVTQGEKEAAANAEAEGVSYVTCPCCGKLTLVKPVEVKGIVLDHYMACIMSGTPFWHEYKIYDGRVRVTVTNQDKQLTDKTQSIARILDAVKYDMPEDVKTDIRHISRLITTYAWITSIYVDAGGTGRSFVPYEVVDKVYELIKGMDIDLTTNAITASDTAATIEKAHKLVTDPALMSAIPIRIIDTVIEAHIRVYDLLMASGFDETFWDGIELA